MPWHSDREWYLQKLIPGLLIGLAFPVVGYYVGWFVGASQTPVVATLIPLVVGLLGAGTVALLERRAVAAKLLEGVKKLQEKGELQVGAAGRIESELGHAAETSFWLPALWSVGVMLFCLACYFGTNRGITQRLGEHLPPLTDLLRPTDDPQERPTPQESEYLHELRWFLASKNYPPADVKSLFTDVINPLFDKSNAPRYAPPGMPLPIEKLMPREEVIPPPRGDGDTSRTPVPDGPSDRRRQSEAGKAKPPDPEQAVRHWLIVRPSILKDMVDRIMGLKIEKYPPPAPGDVGPPEPPRKQKPET